MIELKLMTDSTSDLSPEELSRMDIGVIPLTVTFGMDTYVDGQEIDVPRLFELVQATGRLPKTSAPPTEAFRQAFQPYVDAGVPVLFIGLSSALSSTVAHAALAARELPEGTVYVVDSVTGAGLLGGLLRIAWRWQQEGRSLEEILRGLERIKSRYRLLFAVENLEFLHKGGRLNLAQLLFGSALQIKPIIRMDPKGMTVWRKTRGPNAALRLMLEQAKKDRGHILFQEVHIATTPGDTEVCQSLTRQLQQATGAKLCHQYGLGCILSSHCGPGLWGFGYYLDETAEL